MKASCDTTTEPRRAWIWPAAATVVMSVALCLRWWFGRGKDPVRRYNPAPSAPPDGGIALWPVWDEVESTDPTAPPLAPQSSPDSERELQPVG